MKFFKVKTICSGLLCSLSWKRNAHFTGPVGLLSQLNWSLFDFKKGLSGRNSIRPLQIDAFKIQIILSKDWIYLGK